MHSYSLHVAVSVACLCCQLEQEFIFTSRSDHVICKSCVRHQGSTTAKANLRDADHVALWRSELAITKEDHSAEVDRLQHQIALRDEVLARKQAEISDLQAVVKAGFEKAPMLAVEKWLASEEVKAATDQRDSAYRSRDHAYRALWAVDRLHQADQDRDGHCTCGLRVDHCKVLAALGPAIEPLDRWENNQIDRLLRGEYHGLPDDHPEVIKRYGYQGRRRGWQRPAG